MIYTVTLNPAIDYVVQVDQFTAGGLNRSKADYKEAGGKGINVSRVLQRLGGESTALGFVGGFTGKFITDYLTETGISHDFVQLQADTRINLKMKSGNEETEVNGVSPQIEPADYQQLLDKFKQLNQEDVVVLAGSLPASLAPNTYREIVAHLHEQGVKAILDTSGLPLKEAIQASPAFIKPNHHELAELFEETVHGEEDIVRLAKRLHQENKIQHVLISMAKDGAIYVGEGGEFRLTAPVGQAVHSVGAGDSAVAGFIYKLQQTGNPQEAAQYAIASGSATAFSKTLCTKEEVVALLPQVQINRY
ncbi:1-phosphofructokinase [Gracilibacillus alcaliphilus]|uniref:1-phosphofructokinase n=1 Tax=Gracilibacillus alcaliphilus TaxID=1401441 RepID=UPI0019592DF7|nr:1-phosphofructokinase [Gracilibacillus alcaliphilus]MBM7677036.1 1-phosphofructokinase [Gracilibacillus alcaliphilus]